MKNKKTVQYSILIVILLLLSFFGVKEYLTDEVTQTESVFVTPEVTPAQIETTEPNYENEPPLILDDANDAQVESNEPVAGHSQPRLDVDKQSDEHLSAEQTDSQLVSSPQVVNATPLEQTKENTDTDNGKRLPAANHHSKQTVPTTTPSTTTKHTLKEPADPASPVVVEDNTSNTPSAAPKVMDNDKPNALDQRAMAENKPNQDKNADLELKLAQTASFAGTILSEDVDSSAMVRGVLTSAVGSEIEQWLSQYAFARVQLSLDEDFSLRNSQLDLLFPLQDEEESLSFLQASFHRTDNRNQINVGLGYRWFTSSWMLGGNTFFDYDLSRGHARFGLGLEYSRDFVRVGVNRYIRLTNWKTSSVIDGYNERPASGWDVRVQGWLPQLPQLGGRLIVEQYYGDEVAFTSTTDRLTNPIAISAGVGYSPFPLLSFNLDNKHIISSGNAPSNDLLFSVQLNYELGVPWATQIDPDTLVQARSLIHSRYELVERNNNIILEYQKQPVIVIQMAKTITGYPNQRKPLLVVVKSKFGYDAASINIVPDGQFLNDGGQIDQVGETTYYV